MLPSEEAFAAAADALGITNDDAIVVYDGMGMLSAPRAWWTWRVFGHDRCVTPAGDPKLQPWAQTQLLTCLEHEERYRMSVLCCISRPLLFSVHLAGPCVCMPSSHRCRAIVTACCHCGLPTRPALLFCACPVPVATLTGLLCWRVACQPGRQPAGPWMTQQCLMTQCIEPAKQPRGQCKAQSTKLCSKRTR
jgi:hypothetical protein